MNFSESKGAAQAAIYKLPPAVSSPVSEGSGSGLGWVAGEVALAGARSLRDGA